MVHGGGWGGGSGTRASLAKRVLIVCGLIAALTASEAAAGDLPVRAGEIPFADALSAFDAGIAEMPGVRSSRRDRPSPTAGTPIVETLGRNLDRLGPGQRRVFRRATSPAAGRAPTPEEEILADEVIDSARTGFAAHGYYPAHPIKLTFLDDQGGEKPNVLAYVTGDDVPPGSSPTCNMFITRAGRNSSTNLKRLTLTHEVFHCAQHAFYANRAARNRTSLWVKEGTADWAAGQLLQEMGQPVEGVGWSDWLKHPQTDLYKRDYDAVGFFALLHQSGVNAWSRIKDVISGAANGGDDAAYDAAVRGAPDLFYRRWGPGFVRKPELGPEWDLSGPGIPSSKAKTESIANGKRREAKVPPRAATASELKITADVFAVRAPKSVRGLLRDTNGQLHDLKTGSYCALPQGCKCKTGRKADLPAIAKTAFTGFGGDPKRALTTVFEGIKMKSWCQGKGPKPAPGETSCPTGQPPTRQGGETCEPPPGGIGIYDENENLLANFKAGNCTAGQEFLGVSSDGAWELEVGIRAFGGLDQDYPLTFGADDPRVIIQGPGGPYGNQSTVPSQEGPAPAGSIYMHPNGDLGLAMPAAFNNDASAGVAVAGTMDCIYPEDQFTH